MGTAFEVILNCLTFSMVFFRYPSLALLTPCGHFGEWDWDSIAPKPHKMLPITQLCDYTAIMSLTRRAVLGFVKAKGLIPLASISGLCVSRYFA